MPSVVGDREIYKSQLVSCHETEVEISVLSDQVLCINATAESLDEITVEQEHRARDRPIEDEFPADGSG